jgi:hypothetical protein
MPLLDHFRGPLASRRHWTSFHAAWATYIAEDLNDRLLPGYFAEPIAQFNIEIDVATWEESGTRAEAAASWQPSAPHLTVPFIVATDVVEVLVYRQQGGPTLAAAVELISPANKDRPATREAFVSKCASYLHQGVGLAIVDIVTDRTENLHRQLLARVLTELPVSVAEANDPLYAAAYRPAGNHQHTNLEIWYEPLRLGGALPTLALALRQGPCFPLYLNATYEKTVIKQRILGDGD